MDIKEIIKKRNEKLAEVAKLDRAIEAFQAICEHKWVDDGHDSHHSYHKCTLCTLTEQH